MFDGDNSAFRALLFGGLLIRYGLLKAIIIWIVLFVGASAVGILGLFWVAANIGQPP